MNRGRVDSISSDEMRALEREAIAAGRVTGLTLMERAGAGVVEAILEEWPELERNAAADKRPRAVVLCGPGNNGGDGFVVARLLHERGWQVEVLFWGKVEKLPPDARVNYDRWLEHGPVASLVDADFEEYAEKVPGVDLAIDGLFGIGLSRPLKGLGHVEDELNFWTVSVDGDFPKVVAIDVPSGMCADTGRYLDGETNDENPFDGCALANLTVTFHRHKPGHLQMWGPDACGKVVVKDIGL